MHLLLRRCTASTTLHCLYNLSHLLHGRAPLSLTTAREASSGLLPLQPSHTLHGRTPFDLTTARETSSSRPAPFFQMPARYVWYPPSDSHQPQLIKRMPTFSFLWEKLIVSSSSEPSSRRLASANQHLSSVTNFCNLCARCAAPISTQTYSDSLKTVPFAERTTPGEMKIKRSRPMSLSSPLDSRRQVWISCPKI
jgi:hypothetical protein